MKFSINQDVGCLTYGVGKVIQVNSEIGFVRAEFVGNREVTYSLEGRYIGHMSNPITLFDINSYNQIQDCIKSIVNV